MVETSTLRSTRFLGLDVHKASISVAVAKDDDQAPEFWDKIPNEPSAVRKMVRKLGQGGHQLKAVYEAGPTGYGLHRQLRGLGGECVVAAPALISTPPGGGKTGTPGALQPAPVLRRRGLAPGFGADP